VPTWGRIIATAAGFAEQAPLSLLFPVLALALTTLSLSLVGTRLRDTLDPLGKQLAAGA
jgi:ABC-type dipeptide/oligopeptide/nickel transport system permease subunit